MIFLTLDITKIKLYKKIFYNELYSVWLKYLLTGQMI